MINKQAAFVFLYCPAQAGLRGLPTSKVEMMGG
jgi:hypothetical protein